MARIDPRILNHRLERLEFMGNEVLKQLLNDMGNPRFFSSYKSQKIEGGVLKVSIFNQPVIISLRLSFSEILNEYAEIVVSLEDYEDKEGEAIELYSTKYNMDGKLSKDNSLYESDSFIIDLEHKLIEGFEKNNWIFKLN